MIEVLDSAMMAEMVLLLRHIILEVEVVL